MINVRNLGKTEKYKNMSRNSKLKRICGLPKNRQTVHIPEGKQSAFGLHSLRVTSLPPILSTMLGICDDHLFRRQMNCAAAF
jgi:hypothetical protein